MAVVATGGAITREVIAEWQQGCGCCGGGLEPGAMEGEMSSISPPRFDRAEVIQRAEKIRRPHAVRLGGGV